MQWELETQFLNQTNMTNLLKLAGCNITTKFQLRQNLLSIILCITMYNLYFQFIQVPTHPILQFSPFHKRRCFRDDYEDWRLETIKSRHFHYKILTLSLKMLMLDMSSLTKIYGNKKWIHHGPPVVFFGQTKPRLVLSWDWLGYSKSVQFMQNLISFIHWWYLVLGDLWFPALTHQKPRDYHSASALFGWLINNLPKW